MRSIPAPQKLCFSLRFLTAMLRRRLPVGANVEKLMALNLCSPRLRGSARTTSANVSSVAILEKFSNRIWLAETLSRGGTLF